MQNSRNTPRSSPTKDNIRRQFIGNLVHQIQNHPNKDALVDVQQNQSYNLFSEKPKEMINNMGNMEYIEMCEMYSKTYNVLIASNTGQLELLIVREVPVKFPVRKYNS